MASKLLTAVAAAGIALAGAVAAAPAASAAVNPAYSCTIDSLSHVTGADWLKVHTQASTSSSSVGQLPRGAAFHFCSSSGHNAGGHHFGLRLRLQRLDQADRLGRRRVPGLAVMAACTRAGRGRSCSRSAR